MTRVYRGDVVHGGDAPWVRWEVEWKGKTARYRGDRYFLEAVPDASDPAAPSFVMTTGDMVPEFWGALRGTADFRDRTGGRPPDDCPPLGWWVTLTSAAARRRGRRHEVVPASFQRSASWVINQVAPTLAYLVREVDLSGHGGPDWLGEVIDGGERRLRRRERAARAAAC
jgi:hypothetical protein